MGFLKRKIHASTLMETLVATSIIILVFIVASLVLNNTLKSSAKNDSFALQNRLEELHYLYNNNQITLPYEEQFLGDTIELTKELDENTSYLIITAGSASNTNKITSKYILEKS